MTDDHMVPAAEAAGTRRKSEPQLDHVALVVASLDRSAAFYSGLLGLDILHQVRLSDHTLQYLTSGTEVLLELIQYDEPRPHTTGEGAHHLAWNVGDAAAVEAKVEALGGRLLASCRYVPELDFISMMAKDPDGFLVEVVQRS